MTQLRERTVAGKGKDSVFKVSEAERVLGCGSMEWMMNAVLVQQYGYEGERRR